MRYLVRPTASGCSVYRSPGGETVLPEATEKAAMDRAGEFNVSVGSAWTPADERERLNRLAGRVTETHD